MPLSRDEAAQSLKDIERAQDRSFTAYGYKAAAPFLLLWGAMWFVGYGGTEIAPQNTDLIWAIAGTVGVVASTAIGMSMRPKGKPRFDWRIAGTWLASLAFLCTLFAVIGPVNGLQIGAIIPLFIGWAYVVLGLWMGARFTVAGILIGALTVGGYFYWPAHFAGLMAVVGGGTLIATGLWMRSA